MLRRCHVPVAKVRRHARPRQFGLLNFVIHGQWHALEVHLTRDVFICDISLAKQLFKIYPDLAELVWIWGRWSWCWIAFIVLVFSFIVEEDAFNCLFLVWRGPVHLWVPILVRYTPTVDHNAMQISSLFVDFRVQRCQNLIASISISGPLDKSLFLMVEKTPQFDWPVEPHIIKLCLRCRQDRNITHFHLIDRLVELARSLCYQIFLPFFTLTLPTVRPPRIVKYRRGYTRPNHFAEQLVTLDRVHF